MVDEMVACWDLLKVAMKEIQSADYLASVMGRKSVEMKVGLWEFYLDYLSAYR
jgi:hypothetical protein